MVIPLSAVGILGPGGGGILFVLGYGRRQWREQNVIVALTEQHAARGTLPAVFDVHQPMALEVRPCRERPITHVAQKEGLGDTLVLGEIGVPFEGQSTFITDKGAVPFSVFHEL